MLAEGRALAKIAKNVTVKVPLTIDGLKACKTLSSDGTKVNVTLCFSAAQAILAAKAGASFISPFVGRLDDVGDRRHGADPRHRARSTASTTTSRPRCWSPRSATRCMSSRSAKMGAHVSTMPPNVLRQLFAHPLTDKGLAAFLADWQKTGQSILKA